MAYPKARAFEGNQFELEFLVRIYRPGGPGHPRGDIYRPSMRGDQFELESSADGELMVSWWLVDGLS